MTPAVGTLRYSPPLRDGSTTRRGGGSTEWWLIIECDPELGRLLRHLYAVGVHRVRKPQPPLWGTHVSVIRGEEPPDKTHWKKHDGQTVGFLYEPVIRETDDYLWVPVWCDAMLAHREELGLSREPDPPLHLTIGNLLHE
jgi:hypothetical protein